MENKISHDHKKNVLRFALFIGELMLINGAETYRVEDTIIRICKSRGFNHINVFTSPTVLIISDYKFKDANGAGDSFFSGFLYAYLNGKSIIDCMKYATILGGLCISSYELAHEKLSAELVEQHFLKYYN